MAQRRAATRWWRRGRDAAQVQARAAAAAAASAFVELDALQRRTALQVDAFVALEPDRTAPRIDATWAAVVHTADAAASAYLRVPERYDIDTDLTEHEAFAADQAFQLAEHTLRKALSGVQTFVAQNAGRFARVDAALTRLATAGQAADAAITAAREAIADAERLGMPAHEAVQVLRQAHQARATLAEGTATHGLTTVLTAADTALTEATRARDLARTLPAQREEVRRALTAARTRLEAVATRHQRLPELLSTLRRTYVVGAYSDIETNPTTAARELATARDRLATAERDIAAQHWPRARSALAEARQALDAAADAVDAVPRRLNKLEDLRRDPAAPVARTRFAVREAQRLFVFLGTRADHRYATQLDALVRRVTQVEVSLAEPHPDYWRLDQDLARIRSETAEVVRRLRGG